MDTKYFWCDENHEMKMNDGP